MRPLKSLSSDRRGVTVVEFGIIAAPLCLVLMGLGDLGYQSYLRAVTQGVLDRAARAASVGALNSTDLDAYIKQEMSAIISPKDGDVKVVKKSYYNFSRIGRPEKITSDTAPLGVYNSGDCYEDTNNNGKYDLDRGTIGLGGADDTVFYEVKVTTPRLFPVTKMLGLDPVQSATATAVIRNQPWANQPGEAPVIRCS